MCIWGRRGASGQATFEYLFLIFFTIILISGFVYQFNGAVRSYFQGYFSADGYLACLIEKGILPGESNDEGTCDAPTFDMKNGQQRQVASVDFGNSKNSPYNGAGGRNANGSGGGSSGRSNEGSSSTVPSSEGGKGAFKKGSGGGGGATKKGAGGDTGNNGFSTASAAGGDDGDGGGGSSREAAIPYRGKYSSSANAKKESTVPAVNRDLKTPREVAAEAAAKKVKNKESGFDLSFGNVFKWVFLILLLFAIIFFIGSQIVAVSNGNKKRK